MKQFTPIQLELLRQLADGNCYSGNSIGKQLGISRTAVWKHIRQLVDLGLPINRIPQQGYQLTAPMQFLDEAKIRQHLNARAFSQPTTFHVFATVHSTNQFLKELPSGSSLDICCAETQTNGRGRFGRHWVSPFGENIYCSSRLELTCCLSRLSGLSLIVGLAILASLKDSYIDENIQLKWPNDLLWNNKKLCGILIEVIAETNGCAQVIIGIGLNVNTPTHELPILEKPWCSLYEITGKYYDRNLLLANLVYQLHKHLDNFLSKGFAEFSNAWQKADYLYDKHITVSQAAGVMRGKAYGVNELGQLCLKDEQGNFHYLSSGDTSVNEIKDKS
ncbi:biotin-[acetylCoA carboxylase] holoenzyme synthetase and biotin operon repressor [Legionella lansingensis]|uniref:Bifunctional ligase/repressor BirA n=1 Tax=Legionella lansingensis TaxID=45067 RepID=A0A0W0VXD4_9GAMM|nr:biotin--[acetyl-CoA-carboxylase] ligase [Legionella lansingensis]KTD24358.1 biotin-[acetylCoA carboxylase] holoenzyme synthetase and biotin operon repressor [Legionella lansingensis]SNV51682.1 biotin-[acetylCoA carboxylase] holoenzyme synthetase and biotin operon repressor [Legionella lansingensis]